MQHVSYVTFSHHLGAEEPHNKQAHTTFNILQLAGWQAVPYLDSLQIQNDF